MGCGVLKYGFIVYLIVIYYLVNYFCIGFLSYYKEDNKNSYFLR